MYGRTVSLGRSKRSLSAENSTPRGHSRIEVTKRRKAADAASLAECIANPDIFSTTPIVSRSLSSRREETLEEKRLAWVLRYRAGRPHLHPRLLHLRWRQGIRAEKCDPWPARVSSGVSGGKASVGLLRARVFIRFR